MIRTLYQDKYNPQKKWEVTSIDIIPIAFILDNLYVTNSLAED